MGILVKPVVTEKMTALSEKLNRYSFIVDKEANKIEIKDAVEKMYNVTVEDVNTMNYKGKKRSRYTRSSIIQGKTSGFKKAVVTVSEGETIDFFSNI